MRAGGHDRLSQHSAKTGKEKPLKVSHTTYNKIMYGECLPDSPGPFASITTESNT